jgi:electron-transferring-flavoprotein dehydrogenase
VTTQRERLEADVLIVGAGPAGLACALHLANLIEKQRTAGDASSSGATPLAAENIYVLEKGREVGAHQLSGAVMDPRGLAELVPGFEKTAPFYTPVTADTLYFFTKHSAWPFPFLPPSLKNHGNYVVSLSRLVRWLGALVEQSGVNLFTQFGGAQLLYEGDGIAGVITEDKGLDKNRRPKGNYSPGYEIRAKVTVLAEGSRGSLTKDLVARKKLDNVNPQLYAMGIKELWEVQPGRIEPGVVAHTLGWPLDKTLYGGGWAYGLLDNRVSLGLVIGLDYADPQFDPHEAFQRWKTHPFVRRILDGGKLLRYGAKTIPEGGWYSMPRTYVDGGLIVGDAASFLDSRRLKGIHMAIKSGMLAAETIFDALVAGDCSSKMLQKFPEKVERSWIKKELWPVRNFHQAFQRGGLWGGLLHAGFQFLTGGRGLVDPMRAHAGHEAYRKLAEHAALADEISIPIKPPERFQGDGNLTFDRLTDVYHSGTRHDDDQPCHLIVADTNVCATICVTDFGNPCQYFCPAAVYEMVQENGGWRLKISAANCVHCKTCDVADPYQIINWVVPEGGGGPNYDGM